MKGTAVYRCTSYFDGFFQWALIPPQAVQQTLIFSRSRPGDMIREANVFTGRMTADGMQETTRVIFNITTITIDLISITATIADAAILNETTMICDQHQLQIIVNTGGCKLQLLSYNSRSC